jgi:hypothetical protein
MRHGFIGSSCTHNAAAAAIAAASRAQRNVYQFIVDMVIMLVSFATKATAGLD